MWITGGGHRPQAAGSAVWEHWERSGNAGNAPNIYCSRPRARWTPGWSCWIKHFCKNVIFSEGRIKMTESLCLSLNISERLQKKRRRQRYWFLTVAFILTRHLTLEPRWGLLLPGGVQDTWSREGRTEKHHRLLKIPVQLPPVRVSLRFVVPCYKHHPEF